MGIPEDRKRIDTLDTEIVRLLNERAECARRIGDAKRVLNAPAYVPERERQVLDRVAAASPGPLERDAIVGIYREIMSACRALEKPLIVAYWGPPASNTYVAARKRFGSQAEFHAAGSIPDVFAAVQLEKAEYGVVPVENSNEGVIALTLDQFHRGDLRVCAEINVPIHHHLLSRADSLSAVQRVYTQFQATGQCRGWMAQHLSGIEIIETTTTAQGARFASEDPTAAAIANATAAEVYGLNVLAEHIEDNPRNYTRFWVLGRVPPGPSGQDKTSLIFSVPHQPGALVDALRTFADHGVTLTFIESRPTRQTPWEYYFFVDVLGHEAGGEDNPVPRALADLRARSTFVRVLGSYPEAE